MTTDDLTMIAAVIHSALDDADESHRETPTDVGTHRYEGGYESLALVARRIAAQVSGTGLDVDYRWFVAACGLKP